MKKVLAIMAFLAISLSNYAYDAEIDGIYYNLNSESKTAEVAEYYMRYSGSVIIPATVNYDGNSYRVTSIGNYAFRNSRSLTSVEIPNSVTSIGGGAFYDCYSLTSVEIPNSVTSIGGRAFQFCSGLTSVEIPNSVTSIGSYAFSNCSKLKSVIISNSVTSLEEGTFTGCTGLKSIIIPNSVTSIGVGAFDCCNGLNSVTIGNSVTSIGNYAFKGCYSLTSIIIPNSVTSIGTEVFLYCIDLKDIHVEWQEPLIITYSVFEEFDTDKARLYVPKGTKQKYASADIWKNFGSIIEEEVSSLQTPSNNFGFNAPIYDLSGHRLAEPKTGINIINGKKILIK